MKTDKPKKMYRPEEIPQVKEDVLNAIKKTVAEFTENSNMLIGIDYDKISIWVNITDL